MPNSLTNSSYRFNTTDFTFTQYHSQTLKVKSKQRLLPMSYLVGVVVQSTVMLRHKAGSPYNFSIQFCHLAHIAHTYRGCHPEYICPSILCHIHSGTHTSWTQEVRQTSSSLLDIDRLFPTHHTIQHDMQVTDECALW